MTKTDAAHRAEPLTLQEALAGRYTVERELGRGGMGVVYLARDLTLERQVAIKLLPAELAAQPELRARFLRETRTAAGLSHPNIVPIYSVEEQHGLVFFAMGYVDGETLTQRVRRMGPLPASEVARLLQDAAWALSYAHGRGIVHRDVKPDNILIERATGRAFLTDFGIARVANSTMTAVGTSLGTPQFMSPEQAAGEPVDARSDLYSLGVVGYFALTGSTPFDGPTVQAILAMHLTKPAPPVAQARPGIPPKLAEAVDRCLAKEPNQRFASGDELVNAIQSAQGSAVHVAPQVRDFQRMASMILIQIWTIGMAMFVIADLRRDAAGVAALTWALVAVMGGFQVVWRARFLLMQGFGYGDVRALFEQEMRDQRELDDLIKRQFVRPKLGTMAWLAIAAVAGGMIGTGLTLRGTTLHDSTAHIAGVVLVVLGVLAIPLILLSTRFNMQQFDDSRRLGRKISRLWLGPLGRGVFRLAGWRLDRSRTAHGAPPLATETATSASGVTALLSALQAKDRKQLRSARPVTAALQNALDALDQRERDLDRALAEAGAPPQDGISDGTSGSPVAERREQLLADLHAARAAATAHRAAVLAALEGLRVELLRLRSGIGSVERVAREIEVARQAATPPSAPAPMPAPVATPV
jgi:serine/threonine-protein kinase